MFRQDSKVYCYKVHRSSPKTSNMAIHSKDFEDNSNIIMKRGEQEQNYA